MKKILKVMTVVGILDLKSLDYQQLLRKIK